MMDNIVAVPKSIADKIKDDELNKVFVRLAMDIEYEQIIRDFHRTILDKKDNFQPKFIEEQKQAYVSKVQALKREHIQSANVVINELMEDHSVKPETKRVPVDKQDRIAYELERKNDIKQWELKFQIGDVEELKAMYDHYWGESDFQTLWKLKMQELKENDLSLYTALYGYVESMKTNPAIKELEKLQRSLTFFANADFFPEG